MAGNESIVDVALFRTTADTLTQVTKEMDTLFAEWLREMQALRGVWQGDASNDLKGMVNQQEKNARALLEKLGGYAPTLKEVAGIYDSTEKTVMEQGKTLGSGQGMR